MIICDACFKERDEKVNGISFLIWATETIFDGFDGMDMNLFTASVEELAELLEVKENTN